MANELPEQPSPHLEGSEDAETGATWLPPAPAPIAGVDLEPEDTWMTFGLGADGHEEDRTVTVVFRHFPEDESRGEEYFASPLAPLAPLPGSSRR